MPEQTLEPWLRGPLDGVDPLLAPVLYALLQARENLHRYTRDLADEQIWSSPHRGVAPLGFHLRHIAGSLDRLTTYLEEGELTGAQLDALSAEMQPDLTRAELLDRIDRAIDRASFVVRALPLDTLRDPRSVGRKRLPTTVIGLAIHLAEHTQRHVGQAITTSQFLAPRDPLK